MVFLCIIMIFTVSIVTNIHTSPDPRFDAIQHTLGDQNHFFMMEIVAWNIPLSNGKTDNSLLGVWFWGSVSHFRSQPFVTGSYTKSEERQNGKGQKQFSIYFKVSFLFKRQTDRQRAKDPIPCREDIQSWSLCQDHQKDIAPPSSAH